MENEKDVIEDEKIEKDADLDSDNEVKDEEDGKNADEGEKDPYEAYLEKLEAELEQTKAEKEKFETMSKQKAAAISEERTKRKALEDKLKEKPSEEDKGDKKYLTTDELDALLEAREAKREQLRMVNELTDNEKERQVILKIMEVKGVSAEDAYVLANAHLVQKAKQEVDFDEDSFLADFSASGSSFSSSRGQAINPVKKMAMEGLTEAEKKFIK